MGLKVLLLCAVMACFTGIAFSGITTTPGMQRKFLGGSATFQWSVTGAISSYSVYNLMSGTLSASASYSLDRQNGVVTLNITNIQLSNAGNYTLSVTIGTSTQTDSGALLFVYGPPSIVSVSQTYVGGPLPPATEGDEVQLTCTVISTSLPAAYRPQIYYQWQLQWLRELLNSSSGVSDSLNYNFQLYWIAKLQNISSGPATPLYSDDSIPGYNIKDDGRTLVIASVRYRDTQGMYCHGQEQWAPYQYMSSLFNLPLKYRPRITSLTPASKKFNAILNDYVSLSFSFQAVPNMTSSTNWTFVNSAGKAQDLPIGFSVKNSYSPFSLEFTLTSETYYGNYSVNVSNTIGSTTETFQVLRPGPPDAPSGVRVEFTSHYLITIAWNCMWFNGRQQTIFLQLKALYNNSVVDSASAALNTDCYNATSFSFFENGVYPEMDYEVRVWSTNSLGSSEVVMLTVTTPKVFKFFVSSKNVSLNGNQAVVNFSASESKIARLDVTYFVELTRYNYINNYLYVNSTPGQITVDNLAAGDVYILDFVALGGDPRGNIYYLAMVQGIRVTRSAEPAEQISAVGEQSRDDPLRIPLIVVGIFLGAAILAVIGFVVAIIVFKLCKNKQNTATYTRTQQPTAQGSNNELDKDEDYEKVEADPISPYYTALASSTLYASEIPSS